jgi:gamma-glutamylcyclotransferase (GGCT)/AIG2-like uncharacterized protein YtfP
MMTKIFAYGYLKSHSGFFREALAPRVNRITTASTCGKLYLVNESRIPGMVHEEGTVLGELLYFNDDKVIEMLDIFQDYYPENPQGSMYLRELVPVKLEDGTVETAWVYMINRDFLESAEPVDSGEFIIP